MTIRAYATYMVSVLLFVGQLEAIPTDFDDIEARACRRLFIGPYRWILPEVLKQLKAMHFPVELKCAKTLSVAARSRVLRTENRQHGGLRVRERQRHLQAALDRCDDPRRAWAQQWVPNLSFYHLVRAGDIAQAKLEEVQLAPLLPPLLRQWIDGQSDGGMMSHIQPCAKRRRGISWQKVATQLLWTSSLIEPERHLRRRLDKFTALRCLEGHRVQRVLAILARLRTLVAPRVQSAFLRAVCNGWNASTRYQGTGACRFGRTQGLDSISHFAVCPYTNEWARRFANFRRAPVGLELDYFFFA